MADYVSTYTGNEIDSAIASFNAGYFISTDNEVDHSDASEANSFADAHNDLGSDPAMIAMPRNNIYTFSDDLDVSARTGVTYLFNPGAIFSIDSGKTLTLYSPHQIKAQPHQQIFSGSGTVEFSVAGTVYPGWWGATGDGSTDDTDAMQHAITAAEGGTLRIPEGTYLIDSDTLEVKSNTKIIGESWKTILKGSYTPPIHDEYEAESSGQIRIMLANDDMSSGNSNFRIENIYFDFTAATDGSSVCMHFRNCSDYQVVGCKTEGSGDGISQTYSNNYLIQGNTCKDHRNAAIDQWGQSTDGKVVENTIYGNGTNTTYGILVTGTDTDYAPADLTSENIQIIGNKIYNVTDAGIWLQGGGGANSGHCYDCIVIGNIIDTVTEYHGIKCTSGGRHIISKNNIKNIDRIAISFSTEDSGNVAAPDNCIILGNIINDVSQESAGGYAAISIGTTDDASDGHLIRDNIILGGDYDYGIKEGNTSCVNSIIRDNYIVPGTSGTIDFDAANNYVREISGNEDSSHQYISNGKAMAWRNNADDDNISVIALDSNDDVVIGENTAGVGLNIQNPAINFANLTTSASANTGSNGDVPAQVAGYVNIQLGGVNYRIPYYND